MMTSKFSKLDLLYINYTNADYILYLNCPYPRVELNRL